MKKNNIIKELLNTIKEESVSNIQVDMDYVQAHNQIVPLYIKSTGVVVLGVIAIVFIYKIGTINFVLKTLLSSNFYEAIHNSWLFVNYQYLYPYVDLGSNTHRKVSFINKQISGISVKPPAGPNFTSVAEFLANLPAPINLTAIVDVGAANTLVPAAANNALQMTYLVMFL